MLKAIVAVLILNFVSYSQIFKGPADGSVASGVIVNTNSFAKAAPLSEPQEKKVRNKVTYHEEPYIVDFGKQDVQAEINNFIDPSVINKSVSDDNSIMLQNWSGIGQTNAIPPDPYIAAGPHHVIAVVNSRFSIWDKMGNLIKNIDADAWFSSTRSGLDPFDPKVVYDHFAKRWVMIWLDQNSDTKLSYYLVSVSDDSIPTGTWYNWALPSYKNGNDSTANWADYQGVGFDDKSFYICSNQFSFASGTFQYAKLRIINKNELYANTGRSLNWMDLWDIRNPSGNSATFTIRPTISYSVGQEYYLLQSPNGGGNAMVLYKLVNSLSKPSLTAVNISVTNFNEPPNADQLGGSTIKIESGGSKLQNEPIYKDGFIWAVHAIGTPPDLKYSSLHYVKINVATNSKAEDYIFSAPGYWHLYPNLSVDKDNNVAITYSRSGETEYAGAYYTHRLANDPPGFQGSKVIQTGKANYVKQLSGTRNRWGDYNGISVDPADLSSFWMFSEYAPGINTWGTWLGHVRLQPYPGAHVASNVSLLNFGNVEINFTGDTLSVWIYNLGAENLSISNITSPAPFRFAGNLSLPVNVGSYDSILVKFLFNPTSAGNFEELAQFTTNDPDFSGITLRGKGFEIIPAGENTIYASSGSTNKGLTSILDPISGQGTAVGPSLYGEVKSMDIHPVSKIMYGIAASGQETDLLRVNADKGDAYFLRKIPLGGVTSIVFENGGKLYAALRSGEIYRIIIETGEAILLCRTNTSISGLAVDPATNDLWASSYAPVGTAKDVIFKIDITTGDTTFIGKTGLNLVANDIEFDPAGSLLGIVGTTTQVSHLVSINKQTAFADTIGTTGYKHLTGLAIATTGITTVKDDRLNGTIPSSYSLSQNYPNPFNPETSIEYGLPFDSMVRIKIYNLLGEKVADLVNSEKSAGIHKISWNASSFSSGVYFYEMKASAANGTEYSQLRKMLLMK